MAASKTDIQNLYIRLKAATPPHLRAAHNVELSIPQTAGRNALSKLIYHLLALPESSQPEFHFLAEGEPLRTTFDKFLQRRNISYEKTIEVTYYIPLPEPASDSPINASQEWLSSVHVYAPSQDGHDDTPIVLVGSYSGTPSIHRDTNAIVEESACTPSKHKAPIKSVAWLRDGRHFLTVSQDETARLWKMTEEDHTAAAIAVFRTEDVGDAVSLTSVAIAMHETERAAIGAEDGSVWMLPNLACAPVGMPNNGKRRETDTGVLSAVRIGAGTTGMPIGRVHWRGEGLVSAGWDSLVRVWDVESCTASLTIPCGGKAVMDLDVAENIFMAAGVDGGVRIVDGRDGKGVVAACGLKGAHAGIVTGLRWLDSGRNGVSVGLDGCAKFWDVRAMLSPARVVRNVHDGARCLGVDAVRREKESSWLVYSAGADGKLARITL